jgi:hypothetical protein
MSLMRINHIKNETEKLKLVIEKLIKNYESDFKESDLSYEKIKDTLEEKKQIAEINNNAYEFSNIIEEKNKYLKPLEDLKTFAQFQNELILVKHVALIENMIINLFEYLVNHLHHKDYKSEYFGEGEDKFSDIFIAINKIAELTNETIKIKKLKFCEYYETMRTMRHSIAHGDPLFKMSYRRLKKFNKKIDIIFPYSEINENIHTKNMYPSLMDPTYSNKAKWYCHLSNNINSLVTLNEECFNFINEVRELLLSYGKHNNLSNHELYAQKWRT